MGLFSPSAGKTDAYHIDSAKNEYFGVANKGVGTNVAGWAIFVMWKTGSNWVTKYPVDPATGLASNQPKFVWDDVETLTYRILGT